MGLEDALARELRAWGASIVGFADLPSGARLGGFDKAISIAVRLSDWIIDSIAKGPTPLYYAHYNAVNTLLDQLALRATGILQAEGYGALPIPASMREDELGLRGAYSHKMAATLAGLGWIGKSALLVTYEFGPRVRLATVLTDAPLKGGRPVEESECGDCESCVKACPANAIRGALWRAGKPREELLDAHKCEAWIRANSPFGRLCGICISVCPVGRGVRRGLNGATRAPGPGEA